MATTQNPSEKTYTPLQEKTILSFFHVMNYETEEANINDNCTPVSVEQVAEWLEIGHRNASGVLLSLLNEGIVHEDRGGNNSPIYLVTEHGIHEAFRLRRITAAPAPSEDPLAGFVSEATEESTPDFVAEVAEVKTEEFTPAPVSVDGATTVIDVTQREPKSVLAKNAAGCRINIPVHNPERPKRPNWIPVNVVRVEEVDTDADQRKLVFDDGSFLLVHRLKRFWFPR